MPKRGGRTKRGISPVEMTGSIYTPPEASATVPFDPATEAAPQVPGFEESNGATWAGVPLDEGFTDPFTKTDEQDSILMGGMPDGTSPGPTTPPTTYGKPKKVGNGPKKVASGGSGKLLKRIDKTTGTTKGEARGIMRTARQQVRRGNKAGAKRTISRALSGGPKVGVPRSPQRSKKAAAAATKITKRIATRQAAPAPKRKKK